MSIESVPFNFDELFAECQKLFENAGFDTSDGSNTTQLSAVMAYMVSCLNANTAMNINETILPFATKRKNVLQDARVLGYESQHKISFQYRLKIRLDDKMCGYGTFTIPKYSEFSNSSNKYYYISNDIIINLGIVTVNGIDINPDSLTFLNQGRGKTDDRMKATYVMYGNVDVTQQWKNAKNIFNANKEIIINIKEGELITYQNDVSSLERTIDSITINGNEETRNYIDIPYTDVENDGIECLVSYYDENNNYNSNVLFEKTNDYFFETDGSKYVDKKFIRIDDIEMGTPRVYFKYAGIGTGIPLGSRVRFNLIISKGSEGKIESEYETITIDNKEILSYQGITLPSISTSNNWISSVFDNSIITNCDLTQSGSEEESTRSIIENAPKVYNSAYRLITSLDFKNACNRSASVLDSAVWGGEDEFPKSPGHIWFSFLPQRLLERTFDINADKTFFKRNNSELFYNYAEGDTKKQYAIRQNYYNKNYITNTEIRNYSIYKDASGVHKKYSGIWGDLEGKYVPALVFHHRNPLYLNFSYKFDILRYNIESSTDEVHEKLFNILNNCFYGNDLELEKFDTNYFHTNIVKRLDYEISDLCGFTSHLETQIVLNEKTCSMENWHPEYKDIYIPLAVPFEKYFTDDGFLDTSRLPNIDTKNFINIKFGDVGNYSEPKYTLVKGDIYTDWSRIIKDQNARKQLNGTTDDDYTDLETRLFVVPIKVKMEYTYTAKTFKKSINNRVKIGFKIAPDNDNDESFNNFTVRINNSTTISNQSNLKFSEYFNLYWENRSELYFTDAFKNMLGDNDIITLTFTRTCGYYYLFNGFKKEILLHLFVNGMYDGFEIAKSGMTKNGYYDHYLEKLNETYRNAEPYINDETNYIDITYTQPRSYIFHSTPRSYLCTIDKMYLTSVEATGIELETEQHLFNHDQYGLPLVNTEYYNDYLSSVYNKFVTGEDRILDKASEYNYNYGGTDLNGHYLTSEGYMSDNTEFDNYCGPVLRAYNENIYLYTPLTFDLFKQNLYLNVKYPSENFKVMKNVIPRLHTVEFKNAVEIH